MDALGQRTEYGYDEQNNKISPNRCLEGVSTAWAYDNAGRVVSRTLPLGQVEAFNYDAHGNRLAHTDFNGATHRYSYDVNHRVQDINYADGQRESFQYDALDQRIQASQVNALGHTRTTHYVFDERNRMSRETQATG